MAEERWLLRVWVKGIHPGCGAVRKNEYGVYEHERAIYETSYENYQKAEKTAYDFLTRGVRFTLNSQTIYIPSCDIRDIRIERDPT